MNNTQYKTSVKLDNPQVKVKQITKILLTFAIILSSQILSSHNVLAQNGEHLSHYTNLPAPTHLYVINRSAMSLDEYQMITSLQGLLAQQESSIYVTDGRDSYFFWLESMKNNFGITTEDRTDAMMILEEFKDDVSGYLLTDGGGSPGGWGQDDVNPATSLAGIKNAIIVTEALQAEIDAMGFEMILDVRGMTNEDVFNEYKDQLNNNLLITQNHNIMQLRDYAIATNAFVYHETEDESAGFIDEVYSWVAPDSPQFGWGWAFNVSQKDEREFVGDAGAHGVFTNPSDWVMNLSTFAAVKKDSLKQNRVEATVDNIETLQEAHYLAINMSDGDNYSFVLHGLADEGKYFDSESSGKFPMNWTMPGSMIDLAPAAMQWYYQEAKDTDYFVIGGTGSGYMFPSEYPDLDAHLEIVNEYMGRSDFSYIGMLDHPDIGSPEFIATAQKYATQPNIKGAYYVNYDRYERGAGKIEYVDGKPFIAMRENMWGFDKTQIMDLAEKINRHAKNPVNPEAYTIMNLHAWTHNLKDAELLVSFLEPHVKVVNMDELFQQVEKNVDLNFEPEDDGIDPYASPRVRSPRDENNTDVPTVFSWQAFTDADHYEIIVYSSDFEVVKTIDGIEGTSYTIDDLSYRERYYWRVRAKVGDYVTSWSNTYTFRTQDGEATSINDEVNTPYEFALKTNYPNPFNPTTEIEFSIAKSANVTLEVFNIQGQHVATLVNENRSAGIHNVSFDASALSSGIYIYRLQSGSYVEINKMTLIK